MHGDSMRMGRKDVMLFTYDSYLTIEAKKAITKQTFKVSEASPFFGSLNRQASRCTETQVHEEPH